MNIQKIGPARCPAVQMDVHPPSLCARPNLAILFLTTLVLVGCQGNPAATKVMIPLPLPAPQPGLIEKPYLPILDVPRETIEACENTGDLCGDLVKALDASLEAAMAWGLQQEIVLDGYRK